MKWTTAWDFKTNCIRSTPRTCLRQWELRDSNIWAWDLLRCWRFWRAPASTLVQETHPEGSCSSWAVFWCLSSEGKSVQVGPAGELTDCTTSASNNTLVRQIASNAGSICWFQTIPSFHEPNVIIHGVMRTFFCKKEPCDSKGALLVSIHDSMSLALFSNVMKDSKL